MRFRPLIAAERRLAPLRVVAVLCLLLVGVTAKGQTDQAGWLRTRFRVSITAAEASPWRGRIALSEGRLERLQPLNLEPVIAAGVQLQGGEIRVAHRAPLARDVIDLTTHAPPGAELVIRLGGEAARLPLDEARAGGPRSVALSDAFQLRLSRLAEDRLRVETDRDSLLFAPEETFSFDLLADPPGVSRGEAYDLVVTLARGRDGPELWQGDPIRVAVPADGPARQAIQVPLPASEGAYRVTLTAKRPPGFFSRFTRLPRSQAAPPLAERTFQVAVFDDAKPPNPPGDWRETYLFDPRSHRWNDRLPQWMKWTAVPGFAQSPRSSDGRTDLLAERDGAIEIPPRDKPAAPWRAYPLPVDQPGKLYAVEVEPLGASGAGPTVAVLEPDSLGALRPISGVVTLTPPRWNRGAQRPVQRLLFRPQTASPLLVIANTSRDEPARFGQIRLFKSSGAERRADDPRRLVALDWVEADLPHSVGASHAAQPGDHEAPDLQTWLETARGLADRVEAAGANSAVLAMSGRGATLYPSTLWPSPQHDRGVWRDGSADLPRREGLRVIAREFARRGLRLAPAIRFDAPATGDPLDPDFRARAVTEALDAFGDSEALFGVAVRATPGGDELLNALNGQADPGALLTSYARLDAALARRSDPTPLLLLPAGVAGMPRALDALTPRLRTGMASADEVLEEVGLTQLAGAGRLMIVARPHGAARPTAPVAPAAQADRLEAIHRVLPRGGAESLRADRTPLSLIDAPARLGGPVVLPVTVADPAAEAALIAGASRDGVRLVLLDGLASAGLLDEESAARRRRFAALPPSPVGAAEERTDDVVAAAHDAGPDHSVVTLTNRSAWPRRVQLTIETPSRLAGARLDDSSTAEWYAPGQHAVSATIAPHGVVAWRFNGAGVRAVGLRVDPAPDARRELAERLADLQSRDTTRRRPVALLTNSSFEQADLTGWAVEGDIIRSESDAHEGAASAAMTSRPDAPASLTSQPFPVPATGQLVVDLRLRLREIDPDARLRIELFAEDASGYQRDTELTGEQLVAAGADGWLPPIVFPNDDLPVSPAGRCRLRITLSGEASLLLDDLRTEDLVLPLDALSGVASAELRSERLALVRLMSTADALLAEGRLEACRELLDSYWARFLTEHFPVHEPEQPAAEAAEELAQEEPETSPDDETPSLGERLRGYLPSWWR